MTQTDFDIVISGGGVAGLTAGAAFGAQGFSVLILDPAAPVTSADAPASDLRTTAFLQPARDFLTTAGIWDRLEPYATALQTMRIVDAGKTPHVSRDFDAADISDLPFGWNLPNWLLRREIVARISTLANVDFRPGTGFAQMLTRTTGAHVTLSDRSKITAKLVIGADGRNSAVRHAAGIGARTTRYGQKAITFAVTHAAPHGNISTEIHQSGGPFTLVPLPDHDGKPCSAVVWMDKGPEIARLASLSDSAFEDAAHERSAGLYGPFRLATRRSTWPIISQLADRLTAERTALVGEAAHVMPPIGAQGLNMSLTDLSTLLDLCAAHPADPGAENILDAYAKARSADIHLRVTGIDALNRASIAGGPVLRDLRAWGLRALHDAAPLRRRVMKLGLGAR